MNRTLRAAGLLVALASGTAWAQVPAALHDPPPDPRARLRGVTLSLDLYQQRPFDDRHARLGGWQDRDVVGAEVSYELLKAGDTAFAMGVGLLRERGDGDDDFTRELRLQSVAYFGSAIVRFRRSRTWQPYVTVAGGLERSTLVLSPRSVEQLEDRVFTGFGRASLGLRVVPRSLIWKRASGDPILGMALGIELGAVLGATRRFHLEPSRDADPAPGLSPIRVDPVDAGSLGGSALFSRVLLQLLL